MVGGVRGSITASQALNHAGGQPRDAAADSTTQPWQPAQASTDEEARVARILVSANGVSSYHGRTSALFEDNAQDRPVAGEKDTRMPDDWVERGLVAEAVRQRKSSHSPPHPPTLASSLTVVCVA